MSMGKSKIKTKKRVIPLGKYAGKWVAFIDEKIVAWADSLKELDQKIKSMKHKGKPVYFLMPRKDEGPYIL